MLSPEDAAAVLRRAAELDTPALEAADGFDEQVVREAAREVGLSERAVEQAVTEWRSGLLAPLPSLSPARRAGLPGSAAVELRVALSPEDAVPRLEAWLRGQWFERCRGNGFQTEWRPRRGALASARRATDLDRRLRLSGVGRLRVAVGPADGGGARVRVVADLGDTRTGLLAGLVATPAALTAGGVGVALLGSPEMLLALPAAAGAGGMGWLGSRAVLRRRCAAVDEELTAALESLADLPARRPLQARAAAWALERLPKQMRG